MLEKLSKQELIKEYEIKFKKIEELTNEVNQLKYETHTLEGAKINLEQQVKKLTRIIIEMNAEKYIK